MKDITWYRGDSYPIEITVKDSETGDPITLTGYTFILTVDEETAPIGAATKLFDVAGVIDPDQVGNQGKVSFTPTITDSDQDPGQYYYDIQMTDGDGNIRTIVKNVWIFTQDISK